MEDQVANKCVRRIAQAQDLANQPFTNAVKFPTTKSADKFHKEVGNNPSG